MKIEDLREKKNELTFDDLTVGEVFKKAVHDDTDWTYMKIPEVVEDSSDNEFYDNAICLEDGCLCWFEQDDKVVKVKAKLVIEK